MFSVFETRASIQELEVRADVDLPTAKCDPNGSRCTRILASLTSFNNALEAVTRLGLWNPLIQQHLSIVVNSVERIRRGVGGSSLSKFAAAL